MDKLELSEGRGRTRVTISVQLLGKDSILCIYNKQAHIGAVAVGDYAHKEERVSISLITRLGHKEDAVAHNAAYKICKHTKKPVCVVAGIHLEKVTEAEIQQLVSNSNKLIEKLLRDYDEYLVPKK